MAGHLRCLICAAAVLLVAGGAWADFEAGQHAWDAGRPAEAVDHWRAAADAGDGRAMLALGRLYVQGLGVVQNYIEAHKWFNLAASRGEMEALSERDALAAQMTPQQVAAAQELAASWLSGPDPAAAAPAVAPAPTPAPAEPEGALSIAEVREAQALLTVLGYDPGLSDGVWGRRSQRAYQAFLRDAGRPASEPLTPETLRAMRTMAARHSGSAVPDAVRDRPPEPPAAATPPPARALREAQTLLQALGYDTGRADGVWDGQSAQAYQSFLRNMGLPVSAVLTPEVLRTLRTLADTRSAPPLPAAPALPRPASPPGDTAAPAQPALPRDTAHRLVQAGDIDGLHSALLAGAEVNTRDQRGWTPLMYAAYQGYSLLVPPLVEAQADPDIQAADGATALFMAVLQGHEDIARELVAAGADTTIRGPKGRTALELAQLQGMESAVTLLAGAEADRAAFLAAENADTGDAYDQYIQSRPAGIFVAEARELRQSAVDREAFERARMVGTAQSYREYLAVYPTGLQHETAAQRVTELDAREYERAVQADSASAYRDYLEGNPEGLFADEVKRRRRVALDREMFARAAERDTIEELQAYLDSQPEGAHRDEVRDRLKALREPLVFAEAQEQHTLAAYNEYLAAYPDGAYADLANQMVAQLGATGEFRDCDHCPAMVVIPSGSFMMGSDDGKPDETPRRRVTIAEPFAVGKYEVTVGEFAAFVTATGHDMADGEGLLGLPPANACTSLNILQVFERITWRAPGYGQDDDSPVVCVSWNDAVAYVKWLSIETGQPYRLLSEAEWEYVARAKTDTAFHFGATISTKEANYDSSHSDELSVDRLNRGQSISVGSFPPNRFGVHDVHGNALEWAEDCWHENYEGAPTDGRAWTSDGDCEVRVARGGSWYNYAALIRSAARASFDARKRHSHFGLRVARAIGPGDPLLEFSSSAADAGPSSE